MALTLFEREILRGKIVAALDGAYPHHVPRDILDATLDQIGFWKGDDATLQEIVWLQQSGYLTWPDESTLRRDPEDPRVLLYSYQLTAKGHELATGKIRDRSVVWFSPARC